MFVSYDCTKNQHKLIVIDLSRLKQLDADPKAIAQINFGGANKKW